MNDRRGFTLIELVVVIAIVLVLMGLVLPSATKMWENRKVADAENVIQGLLVTTRARAQRPSATETGLFFYLDRSGAQQVVTIEQVTPEAVSKDAPQCDEKDSPGNPIPHNREGWMDVFRVVDDRPLTLPPPMRVVPRYVVDPLSPNGGMNHFTDAELANNDFENPYSSSFDVPQRQRNFFTMVFNNQGQLLVWRPVLILDLDLDDNERGDATGLPVGYDILNDKPNVSKFYDLRPGDPLYVQYKNQSSLTGNNEAICYLVIGLERPRNDPWAVNFPSVDGLLVYDDSAFSEAGDPAAKRDYLLRFAQPFYVNRLTGAVIRGPLGENF